MQSRRPANGPEGRTDWDAVNWRQAHRLVRNLRQRIFRAARAGDLSEGALAAEAHAAELRQHRHERAAG